MPQLFTEHHDPWRLGPQGRPAPVEGPLPPAACLVDDEGPYPHPYPTWLRLFAAGMALAFLLTSVLTAFATAGAFSPLTDAGNWRHFGQATQR